MVKKRLQQQPILETRSFCLTCQNQKLNPKSAVEKAKDGDSYHRTPQRPKNHQLSPPKAEVNVGLKPDQLTDYLIRFRPLDPQPFPTLHGQEMSFLNLKEHKRLKNKNV